MGVGVCVLVWVLMFGGFGGVLCVVFCVLCPVPTCLRVYSFTTCLHMTDTHQAIEAATSNKTCIVYGALPAETRRHQVTVCYGGGRNVS